MSNKKLLTFQYLTRMSRSDLLYDTEQVDVGIVHCEVDEHNSCATV